MNRRRQQTIADLAAIALCPSLIVLLISSLVFFIVMCVYRGGYSGRIGYIWFMFILGAVGIARLSIQESRKYAIGYAAVLGLATFFVLSRFMIVPGPLAGFAPIINGAMIALVWFLADRITFDCTLIDEDQDASGRGLLDGLTDEGTTDQDAKQHATRQRGHQPGRTVLWLTAAALPIFGLGQSMLPHDHRWQASAMMALAVYLFATLSLLVATSFLGVRRYLRQRGVDMPRNVSAAWLAGGVLMTAIMLAACFLIPQPGQMLANAELPKTLESPEWLKPSKYGWGSETAKPDAGAPDAATAPPQTTDDAPGKPSNPDSSQSSGEPGGKKNGEGGSSSAKAEKGGGANDDKKGAAGEKGGQGDGEKGGKGDGEKGSNGDDKKGAASDGKKGSDGDGEKSESKSNSGERPKPSDGQNNEGQSDGDQSSQKPSAPGEQSADAKDQDKKGQPSQSEQQSPPEGADAPPPSDPPAAISNLLPSLSGFFRVLIYIVLIGILVAFAWFQRDEIAKTWQAFMAWLHGAATESSESIEALAAEQSSSALMPFSAFRNPLGVRGDPREAVIVTYQAAEAWWREHGQPRKPDETPSEYSRRLRTNNKSDRDALLRVTDAYNRIVYGNDTVQPPDLAAAAAVWKSFANS